MIVSLIMKVIMTLIVFQCAPMITSTLCTHLPTPAAPPVTTPCGCGADVMMCRVYQAAACLLMSLGEGGFGGDGQGVAARSRSARPDGARRPHRWSLRLGTLSANVRGPARSHPVVPSCTKQLRTTARGDRTDGHFDSVHICQRPAPFTPRGADVYTATSCLLISLGEGGSRGDGQGVAARSRSPARKGGYGDSRKR